MSAQRPALDVLAVGDAAGVGRALSDRGHHVLTRADASSAWDAFLRLPPDVLVLDWELSGRSAPRLLRQVRSHAGGERPYLIAVLGRDGTDTPETVLDLGADDVLLSPLEGRLLLGRVAVAEREAASRRSAARSLDALRDAQHELGRQLAERATGDSPAMGILEEQVSGRQRAEALSARLAAALESAGEGVVITDPAGRIEYVNRAWERMTGYSREEAAGANPRLLKSGEHDGAFYRELWQTISVGGVWHREFTNRRRDGTLFDVEQTISPVRDASGRTVAFVGIQKDISERKRAELALRRAHQEALEASRLKSVFLGTVSHELLTPLNAILGYAALLREGLPAGVSEELATDVARIEEAGQRLLRRIESLLDVSRLEAGALALSPSPTDVARVLASAAGAARNLAERNGNEFEAALPESLGRAVVDPERLRQVVDAVLENASLLTSAGTVRLRASRDGDEVHVEVADSGPGMDAEQLSRLFSPFSQADGSTSRRHEGLGLSLAIAQRLCGMMGIDLSVESRPGEGTRFRLRLPLHPA